MTPSFLMSHAALFGVSMADAITTNRALRKGYEEDSPILGKHPSPGLVWGYALGPVLGVTVLDYWLEKKNPGVWNPRYCQSSLDSYTQSLLGTTHP